MKITIIDQKPEVHQEVQQAYGMINSGQNQNAL